MKHTVCCQKDDKLFISICNGVMTKTMPYYTAVGYKKLAFLHEPASRPKSIADESQFKEILGRVNAAVSNAVGSPTHAEFCTMETLKAAFQVVNDMGHFGSCLVKKDL